MLTSDAFDKALNLELDRLVSDRIDTYFESAEYFQEIARRVQAELEKLDPFIVTLAPQINLGVYLSSKDCEANVVLDIEKIIDREIAVNDHYQLTYMLRRLQLLTRKVRNAICAV